MNGPLQEPLRPPLRPILERPIEDELGEAPEPDGSEVDEAS